MFRIVAIAAALAGLTAAPAASAAPIRKCGNLHPGATHFSWEPLDGAGTFNVTTRVIRCRAAVRVVLNAYDTYAHPDRRWRWRGWRCRVKQTGIETSDTRCTNSGGRVVRWQAGA